MLGQIVFVMVCTAMVSANDNAQLIRAIVKMSSPTGAPVYGNVTFTQPPNGQVRLTGTIVGMPPGLYGFHVHEKGDLTGGCATAGGHYNPENKQHGHPSDDNRHAGDLGNLEFDENKVANIDFEDRYLCLSGPQSIIGRALVLHEKPDDFGRTSHPDSKKTGNAGGRVACGVIGIM